MTKDARQKRITQLFTEHGARVYAYAYRRTLAAHEAEDIVADTYLIALDRLDRMPERPLPWLLATARWVLANHDRRKRIERRALERLRVRHDLDLDPHEAVSALEAFEQAFSGMSPDDREALMLVDWDGLTNREAATVMGCSAPTFAVRLHRARRRLARGLEGDTSVMRYGMGSKVIK